MFTSHWTQWVDKTNLRTILSWQVMLLNAVKDVAMALGDLIHATKAASGKSLNDPAMTTLKESAKVGTSCVTKYVWWSGWLGHVMGTSKKSYRKVFVCSLNSIVHTFLKLLIWDQHTKTYRHIASLHLN